MQTSGLKEEVKATQCLGWPHITWKQRYSAQVVSDGFGFDLRHYTPAFAKSVIDAWQNGCRMDAHDQAGTSRAFCSLQVSQSV